MYPVRQCKAQQPPIVACLATLVQPSVFEYLPNKMDLLKEIDLWGTLESTPLQKKSPNAREWDKKHTKRKKQKSANPPIPALSGSDTIASSARPEMAKYQLKCGSFHVLIGSLWTSNFRPADRPNETHHRLYLMYFMYSIQCIQYSIVCNTSTLLHLVLFFFVSWYLVLLRISESIELKKRYMKNDYQIFTSISK